MTYLKEPKYDRQSYIYFDLSDLNRLKNLDVDIEKAKGTSSYSANEIVNNKFKAFEDIRVTGFGYFEYELVTELVPRFKFIKSEHWFNDVDYNLVVNCTFDDKPFEFHVHKENRKVSIISWDEKDLNEEQSWFFGKVVFDEKLTRKVLKKMGIDASKSKTFQPK